MLQLAKENLARVKAERDSIVIVDTCPRIRGEQVDIFGSPIDGRSVASETAGSTSSSAFSRAVDGIMADIQLPAADVSTREEIRSQVLERLVGFELERMSESVITFFAEHLSSLSAAETAARLQDAKEAQAYLDKHPPTKERVVTNTCGDDATEVMERDRQEDKEKYSDGSGLADDGNEGKKRKRNRIGVVVDGKKVYVERDLPVSSTDKHAVSGYEVLAECQQSMPGWTWEHVLSALQEKVADLVEEDQVNIAPPRSALNGQHLLTFGWIQPRVLGY